MRYVAIVAAALLFAEPGRAVPASAPTEILAALGLGADDLTAIEAGRPVAKVLPWGTPSEVYVFGAVHVRAALDTYLTTMRDIRRLGGVPGYLGAGELHPDLTPDDLSDVGLDAADVKALKTCQESSCEVQLPAATIEALRDRVDWSRGDAGAQVNALARPMLLQLLHAYQQGGNDALGEYRDKKNPARITNQFQTMIQRASVLPDLLPDLRRYLLEYPKAGLAGADSYFYWEKVSFGLKPTLRVNHAVSYRSRVEGREIATVAIKQLYASHYFHTALDVSVCIYDNATTRPGFYLLTIKASQQDGLTGVKGSLVRRVVVEKTRAAMQDGLGSIKSALETSSSGR